MNYAEREEILVKKVQSNQSKLRALDAKIEKLQNERVTLKRKLQNQETALMNIQVKVAEEREKQLETLTESLE